MAGGEDVLDHTGHELGVGRAAELDVRVVTEPDREASPASVAASASGSTEPRAHMSDHEAATSGTKVSRAPRPAGVAGVVDSNASDTTSSPTTGVGHAPWTTRASSRRSDPIPQATATGVTPAATMPSAIPRTVATVFT